MPSTLLHGVATHKNNTRMYMEFLSLGDEPHCDTPSRICYGSLVNEGASTNRELTRGEVNNAWSCTSTPSISHDMMLS
jgi:hypothetical protein